MRSLITLVLLSCFSLAPGPHATAAAPDLRDAVERIARDGGDAADRAAVLANPVLSAYGVPDGRLDVERISVGPAFRETARTPEGDGVVCNYVTHTVHKKSFPLRRTLYKQHHRAKFCTFFYETRRITRRKVWNTDLSVVISAHEVWSNRRRGVGTTNASTRMGRHMQACYPKVACFNLYPWVQIRRGINIAGLPGYFRTGKAG